MAFTDPEFNVFIPYTVWWTMNEAMLQEKLNAIEKRIRDNIASTKDLHFLYRVAFYGAILYRICYGSYRMVLYFIAC